MIEEKVKDSEEQIAHLKAYNDRLNNYGITIEDIREYCKIQPKGNYTAERILEMINDCEKRNLG